MLSRVAHSVYWTGRYLERLENYARLMSVNINLAFDLPDVVSTRWRIVLDATCDRPFFDSMYSDNSSEKIIDFITFDLLNPNSMFTMLGYARENVRTIKEVLPKEFWESINKFFLDFKRFAGQYPHEMSKMTAFYNQIREQCHLLSGMLDACLSRNEPYYFFSLGKYIERGDKTSRFLDVGYFNYRPATYSSSLNPQDLLIWSTVLKSVSALNMYRQHYKSMNQDAIIEFLILSNDFPRSIRFSVRKAHAAFLFLAGNNANGMRASFQRITELNEFMESNDLSMITKFGLHNFLNEFQRRNNNMSTALHKDFFSYDNL